jgi:hypothetical protein
MSKKQRKLVRGHGKPGPKKWVEMRIRYDLAQVVPVGEVKVGPPPDKFARLGQRTKLSLLAFSN